MANNQGPTGGIVVELASGTAKHNPAADLEVYSPHTSAVSFARAWNTVLATDETGSPGLAHGWAHNWDLRLAPLGAPGTWHALSLCYADGTRETLTVELDGSGDPTGNLIPPVGSSYYVTGVPSSTVGEWDSVTVTQADQTTWLFTPHTSGVYALTQLGNRVDQLLDLTWDATRRLLTIVDHTAEAALLTLHYDEAGYLHSILDASGRKVEYVHQVLTGEGYSGTRTALCQVSQICPFDDDTPLLRWRYGYLEVPASGGYSYESSILLLSTISVPSPTADGESTATILYYDAQYNVAERRDGNGIRTVYAYGDGHTVTTTFTAAGEFVKQYDSAYNSNGSTTSSTCSGCATSTEYGDPNNPTKPTRVVAADGKVTTYTYDSFGNVTSTTDPRGVTITNTYDYTHFALGRLLQVDRAVDGDTVTLQQYTYDEPSGLVQTASSLKPGATDGSLITTTYTYDALGNVLTAVGPGNDATSTITTTYNYETDGSYSQAAAVGQPLTVTDNLSHVTHFRYDARGNRLTVTDALGNTWRTFYNLADQVTRREQPPTGQTGPNHAAVETVYLYVGGPRVGTAVYDEADNLIQYINYHYGLEGELLEVSGGTEPVSYTYDALYRQITLTDGNGNTTHFAYDSKGRQSLIRYPLATADTGFDTVRFTLYDDAGRLLTRVDGNNVTTEYTYGEAGGALTLIHYPADSSQDVTFSHDALGRRAAMSNAEAAHAYTYGLDGRLLSETVTYTDLPAKIISRTYYDNGARATLTTPAGTQTWSYDAAGSAIGLSYGLGDAAWSYLDNGLLAQQTLPNGAWTEYSYDAASQLVAQINKSPSGTVLTQYGSLLHAGTGDLTSLLSTVPALSSLTGQTSYAYDHKRQLTDEAATLLSGYDYANVFDGAGNGTTFRNDERTFNADNQLTGPGTYVYDGNGNPTTYGSTTLTFDLENRMTAYGTTLTAGYRGDGLRAWKETTAGRTYFLYDGISVIGELDDTGVTVGSSVFGAAGLLSYNATQYQLNPLGDVAVRLDRDGSPLGYLLFDAWGHLLSGTATEPYGYRARVGYYADRETGLVALAFRQYAPATGGFLSRDPILHEGGANLFAYVSGNPIAFTDEAGTKKQWQCVKSCLFDALEAGAGVCVAAIAGAQWSCFLCLAGTTLACFSPPGCALALMSGCIAATCGAAAAGACVVAALVAAYLEFKHCYRNCPDDCG